jgi:hypothetical protein
MNTKISQIALAGLLISLIVPQFVLAAWWNPFSWGWFNKPVSTTTVQIATTTATTSTVDVILPTVTTPPAAVIKPNNTPITPPTTVAPNAPIAPRSTPQPLKLKPLAPVASGQDCSLIQSQAERDACYVALSKVTKDTSICPKISDTEQSNACFLVIANFTKDPTVCNLMVDNGSKITKSICLSLVNKYATSTVSTPKSILIAEFLKDPTLDNFRSFCNKAKDIEGSQIEKTMDDSRESLITKKLSYYYDVEDCVYLNNPEDTYYLPLNNDLLVELKSNDPDWFREAKLIYNDKIHTLINTNTIRFIGFEKSMFSAIRGEGSDEFDSIESPKELFAYYFSKINNIEDNMSQYELNSDSSDQIISNYKENYKEIVKRISASVSDMKILYRNLTRI